jgi:hypothetical protein
MQPMFALLLIPHVRLTLKNRENSNYAFDSFAKCHLCAGEMAVQWNHSFGA